MSKALKNKVKLNDVVSVKDYGAVGDGVTDDTTAISNCFAAALNIYFPPGVYICGQVTLRSGHNITGAGQSNTKIKLRSSENTSLLRGNNITNIDISNITLDGNSASNPSGGSGCFINGVSSAYIKFIDTRATDFRETGLSFADGSYCDVISCTIDNNLFDGIQFTAVTKANVESNRVFSTGRFGVVFGSGSHSARLANNYLANNSISVNAAGALAVFCNDVVFQGNIAESNTLGHGLQFNNITRGTMTGNIARNNGISGLDSFVGTYVSITGNISFQNAVRGIEIDSAAYFNTCSSNIVYRNGGAGVSVYRSPSTIVANNFCTENGTTITAEGFGIRLWDNLNTLPSNNCIITGNTCNDTRLVGATQLLGISIEAASTVNTIITGNVLTPNVTTAISAVPGSILRARDNNGFITQNEGSASIASGATSVTLSHGLDKTPVARDFNIVFTNGATNDPGSIWINTITSTQFTVNCRNNPGGSAANFLWRVSVF